MTLEWIPKGSIIKQLPKHYQKFLYEMKFREKTPVHYVEGPKYERCPKSGLVVRREYRPIPLRFPPESHHGLWGGEGIIQGFKKRHLLHRRVAKLWIPVIRRNVVYSEILDTYMAVVLTARSLDLIDQAYGFDFYLLKTPVVDIQSQLGLNLRRKLLLTLVRREMYPDDPKKQEQIYQKYKEFIIPEEEAEWHGLTLSDAIRKYQYELELQKSPMKVTFRKDLIEKLKAGKLEEKEEQPEEKKKTAGMFARLNPFGKIPE